jgi:hypothetical protein
MSQYGQKHEVLTPVRIHDSLSKPIWEVYLSPMDPIKANNTAHPRAGLTSFQFRGTHVAQAPRNLSRRRFFLQIIGYGE